MSKESVFIVFDPAGYPAGLVPFEQEGSLPFSFASQLLLRYRLVEGKIVDRFDGLTDEAVLEKIKADADAQAEADAKAQAEAAAKRPYTIFKTTIIGRMSDKELETFDEGYRSQPLRGRRMWDDCVSLISIDPYFDMLRQLFTASYGPDRAKELLAPIV